MNSRRQFVRQGALATTALLVAGPLKVFANSGSSFTGLTRYNNHLVFLHTAETDITAHGKTIQYIADIKNNAANTILLNGGQRQPVNFKFDVYAAAGAEESDANYTIVTKGGIKTAVITIKTGDADVINKTNRLAAYLKEEKNCQLIVCLSPLGYKHKNAPDDITLAAQSKYIDLIINGQIGRASCRERV